MKPLGATSMMGTKKLHTGTQRNKIMVLRFFHKHFAPWNRVLNKKQSVKPSHTGNMTLSEGWYHNVNKHTLTTSAFLTLSSLMTHNSGDKMYLILTSDSCFFLQT